MGNGALSNAIRSTGYTSLKSVNLEEQDQRPGVAEQDRKAGVTNEVKSFFSLTSKLTAAKFPKPTGKMMKTFFQNKLHAAEKNLPMNSGRISERHMKSRDVLTQNAGKPFNVHSKTLDPHLSQIEQSMKDGT